MNVPIRVDSMKDAERLSSICKEYPCALLLKSGRYCIDPKSTLGILAMMYAGRGSMYLDTNDLDESLYPEFMSAIASYRVSEEEAQA